MTLDLDAGGGVARRRRRCSTSTMLLVPFCSFFVLDLLISPVVSSSIGSALYTGDSRSFRSSLTSSIIISRTLLAAVLHRLSLHPPPQVLLLSLDPEASTTSGCGIPLLSRRSGSAPQCMRGTSSSRCKSTISIPSRRCPEGFYCGSGEIRHTYTTLAPSLTSFVVSSDFPDEAIFSSDALCVPSGGLFSSSDEHYGRRSPPRFKRHSVSDHEWLGPCAWLFELVVYGSSQSSPPTLKTKKMVSDGLIFVAKVRRIFGGFTEAFDLYVKSYLSFSKNLLVDSPGSIMSSPFLLSVKGDVPSVSLPSKRLNFLTELLSCVAVCTGPEDAIKITLVFLVGEGCLSTLHSVTNFQLSDSVEKALSTHSSSVSNSLSSSLEELSSLFYDVIVVYAFYSRGWIIPSCCCTGKG
ncbi:hypothetical protein Bca4012_029003 [Brassica carinata]